jgi:hypothetical protein
MAHQRAREKWGASPLAPPALLLLVSQIHRKLLVPKLYDMGLEDAELWIHEKILS